MSPVSMKILRRVIALFFLLSALFLFIGPVQDISVQLVRSLTWFQFIPSFLNLTTWLSLWASGFFLVIIVTLACGRVYCSFICPLGILQDIFIRLSTRITERVNTYKRPLYAVSFSLLIITILPLFFRNIFFLNLFDPFGLSGKIFAGPRGAIGLSLAILSFFIVLSILKNRWYCDVICPVGIFLGLISRVSVFRLRINGSLCKLCGTCETVCKSNCIDHQNHRIDFDRCVGCMNCLGSCPEKAVKYRLGRKKEFIAAAIDGIDRDTGPGTLLQDRQHGIERERSNEQKTGLTRRIFLKTAAGSALTLAGFAYLPALASGAPVDTGSCPVMPPGALSLSHFTEKCTACHLCISNCPTRVLQTSFFEYGFSGLFQPKMDFNIGFCRYDCSRCTEICPSGALQHITPGEKQRIQIGLAVFQKNQCLVVAEHKNCAKCAEHCPTKAIELLPYLGNLFLPYVNSGFCNGCGACEHFCPVRPDRAIYVESNIYHTTTREHLKA